MNDPSQPEPQEQPEEQPETEQEDVVTMGVRDELHTNVDKIPAQKTDMESFKTNIKHNEDDGQAHHLDVDGMGRTKTKGKLT